MLVKVFKNGNSKAIRIPKSFLDDNIELLEITKEGNKIILIPKTKSSLDELFELIEKNKDITKDFLEDRKQPFPQERELF